MGMRSMSARSASTGAPSSAATCWTIRCAASTSTRSTARPPRGISMPTWASRIRAACPSRAPDNDPLSRKGSTLLADKPPRVALLWHGDREARNTANLAENRLRGVAEALRAVGVEAEPAVYNDAFVDEVLAQLLEVDGALVWVNPIEQGCDRTLLDALLRQVADAGVFVSAHPDIIQKMGTKEVLFRTRNMSWGSDIYLYATVQEFREQLTLRLKEGKPRVLK